MVLVREIRVSKSTTKSRFPFGTFFINASTSRGRGIAHNPSPQRCDIFPFRVSNTLGKSLSSNNFPRQDFFTYAMWG